MIRRNRIDKDALHDAFEHILSKANKNGSIVSFSVACAIVRAMLGEDWFDRYVLPEGKKSFFTVDESSALQLDMSLYRIIHLGELLYNLQHIGGFDECIERLRSGDLESTFAELDFGRMLCLNNVTFQYV